MAGLLDVCPSTFAVLSAYDLELYLLAVVKRDFLQFLQNSFGTGVSCIPWIAITVCDWVFQLHHYAVTNSEFLELESVDGQCLSQKVWKALRILFELAVTAFYSKVC